MQYDRYGPRVWPMPAIDIIESSCTPRSRMLVEALMLHPHTAIQRGVTEPISCLIRKTGVATHAKPHTTIRSILMAPKDKDHPQDKCVVVCPSSIPTDMPRL